MSRVVSLCMGDPYPAFANRRVYARNDQELVSAELWTDK